MSASTVRSIDRVSAYELLKDKIEAIQKKAEEEAERKEWERGRRGEVGRKTSGSARRSVARSPVVKVLTSATFIRGLLGIMKKVIK